MFIGVLQFELLIHESRSLKEKRRVVKSLKDRLHRHHMVSVAEVAAQDHHRLAVMALAAVSGSSVVIEQMLDRIIGKLRSLHDAELGELSRRVVPLDAMEERSGDVAGEALWSEAEVREAEALVSGDEEEERGG